MGRPLPPIVIAVEFPTSSKKYHYLSEWHDVQIGDTVKTPTGDAKVTGFASRELFGNLKSIVAWYPQGSAERKVARSHRINEIRGQLMEAERRYIEIQKWKKLARSVPAIKELLKELEDLLK